MKTLLIPVDFSPTSENAIRFAAEWSKAYEYNRIILLKTFYNSVFDDIALSSDYMNVDKEYGVKEREESADQLQYLCRMMAAEVSKDVRIMKATSELPLLRAIREVIEQENVDAIIAGSDHHSYSSASFVSGNVIAIAKASPVRVLIVPANYTYKPIEKALVPCDFHSLNSLNKLDSLRTSPLWSRVKIMALNVDPKENYLKPDEKLRAAENNLHHYLQNFDHEVYYSNEKNIIGGILNFTAKHPVQLIIAMPGRHSFLYSLTHKSISEAIYKNAGEPVLILK